MRNLTQAAARVLEVAAVAAVFALFAGCASVSTPAEPVPQQWPPAPVSSSAPVPRPGAASKPSNGPMVAPAPGAAPAATSSPASTAAAPATAASVNPAPQSQALTGSAQATPGAGSPSAAAVTATAPAVATAPGPQVVAPAAANASVVPAAAPAGAPIVQSTGNAVGAAANEPANATSVSNAQIAPQPERDLWERIRAGFAMPELDTPLVAEKERFYLERRDYLDRMFTRAGRYLFHIVEEVERRGLPTELALLPFVESAMNPVALSSAQAAGLWQFIPSTGRVYNLSQNWWVDNRRDVVQSTRAALDYLQKIYAMHGNDWFLALASYNWGEGAVARAVKKNQAARKPAGYLNLKMPNETRHYIPKLIAIKHIVLRARELGVALPELPNRPYFVTIEKTRPIDLKLAAEFAGMSTEEFVALNPAHNRPVIAASKNNEIKLPADRVDAFLDAVEKHGESNKAFTTWQPYTLKEGETLATVAQRGGVTAADVARANGFSPGSRILPGTHLLAPAGKMQVDENKVESFVAPRVYEQVERPAVYHRVGKKDSLATIARRYGVSTASLLSWNTSNKGLAKGSIVLVRPAATQTLLTTESGHRQVLASGSKASAKGGAKLAAEGPISPAATAPAHGKRSARATPRSRTNAVRSAASKQSPKKQARKGSGRRT